MHSKWHSQYSVKFFAAIRLEAGSHERSGRKHYQAWERTEQQREQQSLLYLVCVTTALFSKDKQLKVQNPSYWPFKFTRVGGGNPCLLCLAFASSSFIRGRRKEGKATGKVLFHINISSGMQTGLFTAIQFDLGHTKGNGFNTGLDPSCQSWTWVV